MKVRGWAKLCTPEGHSQIRCMLSCEFSQCSMFTYKGRFSFVVSWVQLSAGALWQLFHFVSML